ncbi:MAG: hypothetical protein DMG45_00265 [Acidobacteria bacterium]|nr:MAG: hypothetical protein DMG45_00265 [Acidobacteriota bacterium]
MSGIADISRLASSRMVVSLGSQKRESSSRSWSIGCEWVTIIGSGLPKAGFYREIINTDAETYGGSNVGNFGGVQTQDVPWMGRQYSILIHLPPLATVAFKLQR